MDVSDFDFDLPPESIAQRPAPRGTSRLMTLDRRTGATAHRSVADLPSLLRAGDLLVVNDTRVVPARLFGVDPDGRRTEFLLVERTGRPSTWDCLAKPGRRAKPGRSFDFGAGLAGTVVSKEESGHYRVAFSGTPLEEALPKVGTTPLPPYIHREGGVADARDAADYQTVYAREPGAIAAPTAGLHLTPELLGALRAWGVEVAADPAKDEWLKAIEPSLLKLGPLALARSTERGKSGGLSVHLPPNAVGPHVEGGYTVLIPWRAFASHLSPEGAAVFGGNPLKDKAGDE